MISRRRRAGVWLSLGVAAAVAAGVGAYVPSTLLAPLDEARPTVAEWSAPAPAVSELDFPGYGASAIGAVGWPGDDGDGSVLASSGSTDALPIASISKVVTALVVLDARPLAPGEPGPSVTLTAADAALYDSYLRVNGKVAPSPAGLVLSERQMLEVVLVVSANNYADSLATWAFGSRAAFVDATAGWLADHGFAATTIVEPTGMSPANRSTAADLVGIGELAVADPIVSSIVASRSVTVPSLGTFPNSNGLLGIDGIDGIKTGTLDEAGACLLFSADLVEGEENITVVGVVLGGIDHDSLDLAIRELLADVDAGFRKVPLVTAGDVYGSYSTPWDTSADVVAAGDASMVVWSDTPVTALVSVEDLDEARLGRDAGPVGEVSFRAGARTVEVPLVLDTPLAGPDEWWRLTHPLELWG